MAKLSKDKYLVLMVDDSEDDCLMLKVAIGKAADRLRFIGSVSDGEELVTYLQGAGKYADRLRFPVPDLLLLDLSMPKKDGFEVLKWLQSQPFKDMVVVVLSGSVRPEDANHALKLGAQYYHVKEPNSVKREELIKLLQQYMVRGGSDEE